jgi:prephenate dehydratase
VFDEGLQMQEDDIDKASICFTLPHKPGSLAHILTILSFYDMNLTRIQSLPIPGREWQYFFYADIKFDSYPRYQQALTAVRPLLEDLDILGEYKAAL